MYRQYKEQFPAGGSRARQVQSAYPGRGRTAPGPPSGSRRGPARPGSAGSLSSVRLDHVDLDPAIERAVAQCWRHIDKQCLVYNMQQNTLADSQKSNSVGWKTIRVFVSSTFTDFHNEREILVKKVFPLLREWCESRKLQLVECDLRWGVPKDSSSTATITTCMEELDRCHDETDGQPFFINMIGERYGWVPQQEELPATITDKYNWVPGVSITHMEIIHAAFRNKNPNAVFFVRNPSFLHSIPQNQMNRFVDTDPYAVHHLRTLKSRLVQQFPNTVSEYSCRVAGIDSSTGREKVLLCDLEDYARRVLEYLQTAIDAMYPARLTSKVTQETQEYETHNAVMESKVASFCGREQEVQLLLRFACGDVDLSLEPQEYKDVSESDGKQLKMKMETYGLRETDNRCLCLLGDPGFGKSALLAKLAKVAQQNGLNVLYHNVGCTGESLRGSKVMGRIVTALIGETEDEDLKMRGQESVALLQPMLKKALEKARQEDTQLLLILDGVEEMHDASAPSHLSWLPEYLPGRMRCIVSARTSYHPQMWSLRQSKAYEMMLQELDAGDSRMIVENFFFRFNKRLDEEQMLLLLRHQSASLPLWLALVCEELRVYGDFRSLTGKIRDMPASLSGMMATVIHRLVAEDDTNCMKKLLCLLCCSLDGIAESEMCGLLGNSKKREDAPLITWATLRRAVKPFLNTVIFWFSGALKFQLFHQSMKEAVREELLAAPGEEEAWHTYLADYYQHVCTDPAFTVEDLPHHLHKAGLHDRLVKFYREDIRSSHVPMFYRQHYLNRLRCKTQAPPMPHMSRLVKMCRFCCMKKCLISPTALDNKSLCMVCGAWVPQNVAMAYPARHCLRHAAHVPPNMEQCVFCRRMIQGPLGPAHSAMMCMTCGSGIHHNRCCQLVTETTRR